MKFLIDNAISPTVASALKEDGYDTLHVKELKMQGSSDKIIFEFAKKEGRVLVSADTDFGNILLLNPDDAPSLILFRSKLFKTPASQVKSLRDNLKGLSSHLEQGCIAVIEETRIRIRKISRET